MEGHRDKPMSCLMRREFESSGLTGVLPVGIEGRIGVRLAPDRSAKWEPCRVTRRIPVEWIATPSILIDIGL